MKARIVVLGDYNPAYSTHHALNDAITHLLMHFGKGICIEWIGTNEFNAQLTFQSELSGLWIAPGSPYNNMENVIDACTFTRVHGIPTLGNCGGFQHMLIEFARNVCQLKDADTAETNAEGDESVISKLSCSMVDQEEVVTINPNSMLHGLIAKDHIVGKYFCNYGLNPIYRKQLEFHAITMTAFSPSGEIRAFELSGHPFFIGTLFQPALTYTPNTPDPLLKGFVQTCIDVNN